jgi:hypothetical protein
VMNFLRQGKKVKSPRGENRGPKSDVLSLLNNQSPVRSQARRGTCSIFSATAMLESMLIIRKDVDKATIDLSEEFLEYLVNHSSSSDGSTSYRNYSAFRSYGDVEEPVLPYIGETWKAVTDSPLAQERCGKFKGFDLSSCLIVHRNPNLLEASIEDLEDKDNENYDPEFAKARVRAGEFKGEYLSHVDSDFYVSEEEAKDLLFSGIPVTIDLDFYYGSWNHGGGVELNIPIDSNNWAKGIVGYPEVGSRDREWSHKKSAGHSVLLVGYDDDKEVTQKIQMVDGTYKTFTHKGVYYFKNSWGTAGFGKDFQVESKTFSGYGMITQDYASEYGSFFQLKVE